MGGELVTGGPGLAAPVDVGVRCAGQRHVLSWDGSTLTAADHPDPVRERALVALGGRPYRCLELLDDWERHADDLDVLVLASRGVADDLRVEPAEPDGDGEDGQLVGVQAVPAIAYMGSYRPRRASFGWYAGHRRPHFLHMDHAHQPANRGIDTLLTLDRRLADCLVYSVVTTWAQRIAEDDPRVAAARPALQAALYGRAARTVRTWLGDPKRAVDVRMPAPGEPRTVTTDGSGAVSVALGFGWLAEVWLPGIAVTLDRFCLSAVPEAPTAWTLETVGRDLQDISTMRVTW